MTTLTKLDEFNATNQRNPQQANYLLFTWLSDDRDRADLYRCLLKTPTVLAFQSRADVKESATDRAPSQFHQTVYLLTARDHVKQAFQNSTVDFSNSPYQALGSGTFMLGLDHGADHTQQHKFARDYLYCDAPTIEALCSISFMTAAVLPLKQRAFDLADLAEQAALRFVGFLFGFAQADHVLLEGALRKASSGLAYQTYARHFVTDPFVILENSAALGALAKRVADLIGLYQSPIGQAQTDELATIDAELAEVQAFEPTRRSFPLKAFSPVLRRMAQAQGTPGTPEPYSAMELAVIVVGLIAGTVGNAQSGVAMTINQFFRSGSGVWERAHDAAVKAAEQSGIQAGPDASFTPFVWEALRLNPPAAFLPRKTTRDISFSVDGGSTIPAGSTVILALGAATRDLNAYQQEEADQFDETRKGHDPLIFGGDPSDPSFVHQCVGQHLAMPLITHIARQTLLLEGLAERISPRTGQRLGLQKKWGYTSQSYPMEFNRSAVIKQSPLNVIMNVKLPLSEHAEKLKQIIQAGAPRIEKKLIDAKHVHFAQFMLFDHDSKLALFTIYDRDFDSYIEHFALQIGPLFDRIFEHIQDAPPLPVNEFPKEFVDTIRHFHQRAVGDYFFSAYPKAEVAQIQNDLCRHDQ
jgi:cytochrome P450